MARIYVVVECSMCKACNIDYATKHCVEVMIEKTLEELTKVEVFATCKEIDGDSKVETGPGPARPNSAKFGNMRGAEGVSFEGPGCHH